MDPSASNGDEDKMQKTKDDMSVGSAKMSHVSSVKRRNISNSVIDLGRANPIGARRNSNVNRPRSKSWIITSTSTTDYYVGPSYSSDLDSAINNQDRTMRRSNSVHPVSTRDARPPSFSSIKHVAEESNEGAGRSIAPMSVSMHAEYYNMDHKNRGKCVIFNHENFNAGNIEQREGTEQDVMRLQRSFGRLGFDIEVHRNLSHADVMDTIKKLSELDHTDNDCLCIIVLTHGFQNDLLWATDAAYKLDNIWKPFTADKCKTLAGKPKLFFVQACRGDELDGGVVLATRSLLQERTDSEPASYKIPTHADFLIAHSTASGFASWRDPTEGSWYIQCLCDVLDEYAMEMDLMNMLTLTTRKVAMDYASRNDADGSMNDQKQVPSVTTMLIRSLYFPPKSN